jgi:hypothetical protein
VEGPGPFTIAIAIPADFAYIHGVMGIKSKNSFVPQQIETDSPDTRHLVFKVFGIEFK